MNSAQYKIVTRTLTMLQNNREKTLAETYSRAARAKVEARYSVLIAAEMMRVNAAVFAAKAK